MRAILFEADTGAKASVRYETPFRLFALVGIIIALPGDKGLMLNGPPTPLDYFYATPRALSTSFSFAEAIHCGAVIIFIGLSFAQSQRKDFPPVRTN